MIDFSNAYFVKMKPVSNAQLSGLLNPILIPGEKVLCCYQGIRDGVAFTDKRIIVINAQGLTGKKKDFTSLPYNKIQAYSVETAGVLDTDCELDLWFSGLGKVRIEFINTMNISEICQLISENVL